MTHSIEQPQQAYEDQPPFQPITVFDLDSDRFVRDAKTADFTLDVPGTVDFLAEHDHNNRLTEPVAVGIYRPDGKTARENPKLLEKPGFIAKDGMCFENDQTLPMPIVMNIGFQNEEGTNAIFRHEIFHYVYGDQSHNRLYHRENVKLATRLGGLATSLTSLSSLPTLFNKNWLYAEKVIEQTSPGALLGAFAGLAATSLYGAAIARNPYSFLHRLDKEERDANAFARQHKDFNPITLSK